MQRQLVMTDLGHFSLCAGLKVCLAPVGGPGVCPHDK